MSDSGSATKLLSTKELTSIWPLWLYSLPKLSLSEKGSKINKSKFKKSGDPVLRLSNSKVVPERNPLDSL